MKREPGALYPSGSNTGAVPATVSGRGAVERHWGNPGRQAQNPKTVSQKTCQAF